MAMQQEGRKTWEKRVAAYKESHEKLGAWCSKNGIKEDTLRYWIKKEKTQEPQRKEDSHQAQSLFVLAQPECESVASAYGAISVTIGRAVIEIGKGSDITMLADVLRAVAATC